jgi:sugar transferase (PEP-CTERM/EpsH1 system associated)
MKPEPALSIRILHVLDNMGRGGMQNGLVNLIEHLDHERFEHIICSTRYLAEEKAHQFPPDRVRVMCVGSKEKQSRLQIGALARTIKELQPDLVHSRNWGGAEAVLAGRWAHGPALIHSEHGLDPDTVASEPWRRIAFRRLAFELADKVVCVSDQLRQLYSKRVGFPQRKMTVIHNGVDSRKFSPDAEARIAIRRELGIADGDLCIGCVGRLSPIKDYPTVLRAVEELNKTAANWRLLVIGEGPERAKLEEMMGAHPDWRQRIVFAGLSTRIPKLLNAMDIYVLASITEGISNSLLEAMATGLPVVVTATGGNPEVVVDGASGVLFPVGDSMSLAGHLVRLQARPAERGELGAQALRRVCNSFSLEAMVHCYEQLYESLVPQPKVRLREVTCI